MKNMNKILGLLLIYSLLLPAVSFAVPERLPVSNKQERLQEKIAAQELKLKLQAIETDAIADPAVRETMNLVLDYLKDEQSLKSKSKNKRSK